MKPKSSPGGVPWSGAGGTQSCLQGTGSPRQPWGERRQGRGLECAEADRARARGHGGVGISDAILWAGGRASLLCRAGGSGVKGQRCAPAEPSEPRDCRHCCALQGRRMDGFPVVSKAVELVLFSAVGQSVLLQSRPAAPHPNPTPTPSPLSPNCLPTA